MKMDVLTVLIGNIVESRGDISPLLVRRNIMINEIIRIKFMNILADLSIAIVVTITALLLYGVVYLAKILIDKFKRRK